MSPLEQSTSADPDPGGRQEALVTEERNVYSKVPKNHRWHLRKGGEFLGALLRHGYEEWGCRDDNVALNEGGSQMVCYYLDKLERGLAEGSGYLVLEHLRWLSRGFVLDQQGQSHFLLSKELSALAATALDYIRQAESSLDKNEAFVILRERAIDSEPGEASLVVRDVEARVEEKLAPTTIQRITRKMVGGLVSTPSFVQRMMRTLGNSISSHGDLHPSPAK